MIAVGAVPQLLFLVVGYLWMTRRLNRLPVAVPSTRQFGVGVVPTVLTRLGQQNTSVLLFARAAQLVLVGPAEGFLYRGALQGQLRTVFGYLFERTDNLVVPIPSHSLLNVVFTTLTIAPGV